MSKFQRVITKHIYTLSVTEHILCFLHCHYLCVCNSLCGTPIQESSCHRVITKVGNTIILHFCEENLKITFRSGRVATAFMYYTECRANNKKGGQ